MELCILCNKYVGVGEVVTLRQKGADSINKASKERGDELEANPGSNEHKSCWLEYTNAKSIKLFQKRKGEAATEQRRLLRSDSTFDFRTDCAFCGKTTQSKQFHDKSQVICVITSQHLTLYHRQCNTNFRTFKQIP